MTAAQLTQLHAEYRKALEASRDEAATDEARELAITDALAKRSVLDSALIDLKADREADEARSAAESIAHVAVPEVRDDRPAVTDVIVRALNEHRKGDIASFNVWAPETRVDVINVTNAGAYAGYTVPTTLSDNLWIYRRQLSPIRDSATVIATASGETINLPTVTTDPVATWKAEDTQLDTIYPVFGQKSLTAWKLGGLVVVSSEMLRDSIFDLGALLGKLLGRDIGQKEGVQFIQGDGTTEPGGILIEGTSGKTTAAATSFTLDELLDLKYSVAAPYRVAAKWAFADTGMVNIAKLKDGDGGYYFQPSIAAGTPDMLFGQGIIAEPNMNAVTAGLKPVAYGDMNALYIRDVGPLRVDVSFEFKFDYDVAVFRALHSVDSTVIDASAIKYLTMHA